MVSIDRPGPAAIAPYRAPGGVVVQVYNRAGLLLLERPLPDRATADRTAGIDAAAVARRMAALGEGECVVVAYDGDTGERLPLRDILGTDRLALEDDR